MAKETGARAALRRLLLRLSYDVRHRAGTLDEVWIDVGAHRGETTLKSAMINPRLTVFAFEPNWKMARGLMGKVENFVVIPMAVSNEDGMADFNLNATTGSSSLLEMNEKSKEAWQDYDLTVTERVPVPTIRIDTFMRLAEIETIHFLKIDAEGADVMVIESCGERLKDVRKIKVEVDLLPKPLYEGALTRDQVVAYMAERGFALAEDRLQNQDRQANLTFVHADST